MIISTSHKFVYCAVPKVASRALRGLLEPMADERLLGELAGEVRNKRGLLPFRNPDVVKARMAELDIDPRHFFWFGFMRNPWDRVVSRYKFEHERAKKLGDGLSISSDAEAYHRLMIDLSWDEYLNKGLYPPQTNWLRGRRRFSGFRRAGLGSVRAAVGEVKRCFAGDPAESVKQGPSIAVDRIYRMEEMGEALKELGDRIGAKLEVPPVRGATKRSRNYQDYFENASQVELVARYYTEDILLGGYGFHENIGASFDIERITGVPWRKETDSATES